MTGPQLPEHLRRYVVEQDYSRYTNVDQAVWRFIMRRLKNYLAVHAHTSYLDGLEKTGISTEQIPKIEEMDRCLNQFGWRAVAVSGFIPPAAFMELQSLGILPIACDMRTLEHAAYTPAPDIVHEAAGHAPMLINPEFARYLHEYAQVAKKAILNKEDLDIYEAIRSLSDLKEDPNTTPEAVENANARLQTAAAKAVEPSEGALLARMNWWTAEYGLIGDLDHPQIYGAGLLSSVGESATALREQTRKIPFSLRCLDFSYDITEPQPQLFVTPSFEKLTTVLHEMADTMSFKIGGAFGLERAKRARTVNTVEFDTGIQISGVLKNYLVDNTKNPIYLQFEGPSQLAFEGLELPGQGLKRHAHGFGTPVGKIKNISGDLSELSDHDLKTQGLVISCQVTLEYVSGATVDGILTDIYRKNEKIVLMTFTDCSVTYCGDTLFKPEWGAFDMAVGSRVASVFGGAADRAAFGATEDFVAKRVPTPIRSPQFLALNEIFRSIRTARKLLSQGSNAGTDKAEIEKRIAGLITRLNHDFPNEWLTRLEILEICVKNNLSPQGLATIQEFVAQRSAEKTDESASLGAGLRLIEKGV